MKPDPIYDQLTAEAQEMERQGHPGRAAGLWRDAAERNPGAAPAQIGEIRCLTLMEDAAAVRDRLAAALAQFGDHPGLIGCQARAALRFMPPDQAAETIALLAGKQPENLAVIKSLIALLRACGRWEAAYEQARRASLRWPDDLSVRISLAGLGEGCESRSETVARWHDVLARSPGHPQAVAALWRLEWRTAPKSSQISALRSSFLKTGAGPSPSVASSLIEGLIGIGRAEEAVTIAEEWIRRDHDNPLAHKALTGAHRACGNDEAACMAEAESLRLEAETQETDPLDALLFLAAPRTPLEKPRLPEIAAARRVGLGRGLDEAQWEHRVRIALGRHTALTYHTTQQSPELAALDARIELTDPGLAARLARSNRGAILVSSHQAYAQVSAYYFSKRIPAFTLLAGVRYPDIFSDREAASVFLGDRGNSLRSVRHLLERSGHGQVLAITPDIPMPRDPVQTTVLGRTMSISALASRIAHRRDLDMIWCAARFKGDVIEIALEEMPAPVEDESRNNFVTRWAVAYGALLTEHVNTGPDNCCFAGRFWRDLAQSPIAGSP